MWYNILLQNKNTMQNTSINFTNKDGDPATMAATYIGNKSMGIDGNDHYFDIDFGRESIDEVAIDDWFHANYYKKATNTVRYFCDHYTVQYGWYSSSKCTVIIHWRYDV